MAQSTGDGLQTGRLWGSEKLKVCQVESGNTEYRSQKPEVVSSSSHVLMAYREH